MRHILRTALFLATATLVLSGCGVTNSNSFTARSRYIEGGRIKEQPKAAEIDIDFSTRVTATSGWQITKSAARAEAEHKAILEYGIDLVVEPIWKYTASPVFSRTDEAPWYPCYKAELVGFAGKYRKTLTTEEQIQQLQNIDMETIEKYKLLTDPEFKDVYYQSESQPADNSVKGSVIISGGLGLPVPTTTVAPSTTKTSLVVQPTPSKTKPVKQIDYYKRGTTKVKTGQAFFGMGVAFIAAGFSSLIASEILYNKGQDISITDNRWNERQSYINRGNEAFKSMIAFFCIGGAFEIIGIPCWAVGAHELKNAKNPNLSLNYQVAPTGVNLALNF